MRCLHRQAIPLHASAIAHAPCHPVTAFLPPILQNAELIAFESFLPDARLWAFADVLSIAKHYWPNRWMMPPMTSPAPYLLRTGTVPAPKPAEKPLLSRVFRRFSQEILLAFGFVLLTLWLATLISHHPADSAWSTTGSHLSPSNWL